MLTHKVRLFNRQKASFVRKNVLKRAALDVLSEAREPVNVNIAVVDDGQIRRLNAKFSGVDSATDVLAFPMGESLPDEEGTFLGDVVVSAERAAAVAEKYGHTPEEELVLYVVHGLLHLLGYDDATGADARCMRARERHYLDLHRTRA